MLSGCVQGVTALCLADFTAFVFSWPGDPSRMGEKIEDKNVSIRKGNLILSKKGNISASKTQVNTRSMDQAGRPN